MKAAALLATAHEAGVSIALDGSRRLRLAYARDTDPALLDQLRTNKDAIVAHLSAAWMPAGLGRCPCCREFTMLPAGPEDGVCDACALLLADEAEVDRLLRSGHRAVAPALAADEGEVWLRGEAP